MLVKELIAYSEHDQMILNNIKHYKFWPNKTSLNDKISIEKLEDLIISHQNCIEYYKKYTYNKNEDCTYYTNAINDANKHIVILQTLIRIVHENHSK